MNFRPAGLAASLRITASGRRFHRHALGILLMLSCGHDRAVWAIVPHKTIIKRCLVLLAGGFARFLGQPRQSWIGISLLLSQVAA